MLLKYFDGYVSLGLRPIAIYNNTKRPVGKAWNKDWNPERWRPYFENDAGYNIGLLLGDIVDVEGDSDEANDLLERMIDGIPHPMYRSNKSVHHLFLNPDPKLTRFVTNDIEFRANLHQSVVPPSVHNEGIRYQFLRTSKWPAPPMPEELHQFYRNKCKAYKPPTPKGEFKEGYTKTCCAICKQMRYIHKKRLMLEMKAFGEYNLPWMCHHCREFDLRESCRRIRKAIQQPNPILHYVANSQGI